MVNIGIYGFNEFHNYYLFELLWKKKKKKG